MSKNVKEMNANKSIVEILEEVSADFCNNYCKWPTMPTPEGRDEEWLTQDEDSPCFNCPIGRLE